MHTLNFDYCESSILSCSNNQVDSPQPHARIVTLQTCVIPSDIRHRFNVFVEAVEKNCEKMHTVKEYIRVTDIPFHKLTECTHLCKGVTPKRIIQNVIYKKAKELLLEKGMRVKDVKNKLNFSEMSTFCRFFKSFEGLSPRQYQRACDPVVADGRYTNYQ